ncbi:TRADD-N-associated membrane domain-containing protein [Ktedonobacter racemifer]|uniref:Cyanobacterial TRADD-N associated 2 transmembrane domain-containing protein n=1 Tax=Ktedonobacter racemifer DSM 44963 TaxID=485913 RepID=D6U6L9_KTERA|nr:hypothetical protein [Ktedonobacter racemifer]EFH80630.1 hypothetical protein Krac_1245 [Ktedonobacter racemifer DSM 44963]
MSQNSSTNPEDLAKSIDQLEVLIQQQVVSQNQSTLQNIRTFENLSEQLTKLAEVSEDQMDLLKEQLAYQQQSATVLSNMTSQQVSAQQENTQVLKELLKQSKSPLSQAVANIAGVNPGNIQEVAASQLAIINSYYQSGLEQSRQSLRWSLVWCGIGFGFFLTAVGIVLFQKSLEISIISVISGAIIEVSASTYLLLHRRASDQLSTFRSSLESTQWILLANSMCENLEGEIKQNTRSEIIRVIVNGAIHKQSPTPPSEDKKSL